MNYAKPVEEWPHQVEATVYQDEETNRFHLAVWPNEFDDPVGREELRAASRNGAHIEATAAMAKLGYDPAPGRPGRWQPDEETDDPNGKKRVFRRSR